MTISAYAIHTAMQELDDAQRNYDRAHPSLRNSEADSLENAFIRYAQLLAQAATETPNR